jgi:predicted TIM-barrel fold metal-dependent hydrolase
MAKPIISADSHLTEPPNTYIDRIDAKFRDRAPRVAFQVKDLCNVRRLMWANDFPHSDSTWPNSQAVLAKQAAHLTEQERDLVLHDNVAELYGLEAASTRDGAARAAPGGERPA